MAGEDREQQFERALTQHLRDASPDVACPDAETLAAYHERNLSLEELSHWREHIAGCVRCQESLALVERCEDLPAEEWEEQLAGPAQPMTVPQSMSTAAARIGAEKHVLGAAPQMARAIPATKTTTRLPWRWVVPVGVLAASVIVWIGVKGIRTQKSMLPENVQVAENRPVSPSIPARGAEVGEVLTKKGAPNRLLPEADLSRDKIPAAALKMAPQEEMGSGARAAAGNAEKSFNVRRVAPVPQAPPVSSFDAKSEAVQTAPPPPPRQGQARAQALAPVAPQAEARRAKLVAGHGRLSGKVTDPSGAVVAGTTVRLFDGNGAVVAATSVDNNGDYYLSSLPAGQYRLEFQEPGFKTNVVAQLNVSPGENQVNSQLQVGAMTEAVEVTTANSAIEAESAQVSSAAAGGNVGQNGLPLPSAAAKKELFIKDRNVANLVQLVVVDPRHIVAPGERQSWRVGQSGKIEHSADHEKTWKLQKSGVRADLTAGSAPSDKVCWVAGKSGTLLLTIDGGKHWKSISSPIAEDLGGVRATDASHATVWDVLNRRSYETTDGGATWTPLSNK